MSELRTFEAGSIEFDASDGRNIEGYAYRWGELSRGGVPETGGRREGFEQGAFQDAIAERGQRPWPFLDIHTSKGGRTVAGIRFAEDATGLRYTGRLLDTESAREYAAAVREAGRDEVSLELVLDMSKSTRKGDSIIHRRVERIAALASVPFAAYAGATVAVREANVEPVEGATIPVSADLGGQVANVQAGVVPLTVEQTTEIARRVTEDFYRAAAERSGKEPESDPILKFRSLGEMAAAAERGEAPRNYIELCTELAERALADIVTTAGVNAALLTGNLTVREVVGIVSRGRPAITAFGGPGAIPEGSGLTVSWPYYDGTLTDHVAAQSAQKAEIESAVVDIKLGSEAILTYAGGADIAYQLIRQGDPSILDIFARIMLTAWGVVTDAAFVTELESGSVTSDLGEAQSAEDLTEFTNRTIDNALAVQTATGLPAEFILASTTTFAQFAKLLAAKSTTVELEAGVDIRGLAFSIGGLPLIHVPSITAGKRIVSNRLAARWHEAGPFQAAAEDVAHLGKNVAYWSLGAGARYIPAGIIEVYDVTP